MARRSSLIKELEVMRAALRKATVLLAAADKLYKSIERNAGVAEAMIGYTLARTAKVKGIYSIEYRCNVVADCMRYGTKRASILYGVPFWTAHKWFVLAKRIAKTGRTVGGRPAVLPVVYAILTLDLSALT